MTEIYLIRHTQAEGNIYRVMQGHWDGDVTPFGVLQLHALAERFRTIRLDAVYSSDLYRAYVTAKAVTEDHGPEIVCDKRLRELDMGSWEGRFFGNKLYETPDIVEKFLTDPWEWKVDGAETLEAVAVRAVEAVNEYAEKHDGQKIAVVSHGVTIRCLLTKLLGLPTSGDGIAPIMKNTAVSKLIYDNGSYTVEFLNDVSHLGDLPVSDWVQRDGLRHVEFDPADDKDYYTACYSEAWSFAHQGNMKGYSPEAYFQAALRHHAVCRESVLRFYSGDIPAGILDLDVKHGEHAGYGWISLLYLQPEFRNRGYGIQALARAIMLYHQLGRKSIRLHVAESNEIAVKFYEKYGFRILSSEPGANGALYLMERSLERRI